jgi:hypothetical protein
VEFKSRRTFHGVIIPSDPDPKNPAVPKPREPVETLSLLRRETSVFVGFDSWLREVGNDRGNVFWSDNPAFDWQWINDGFLRYIGKNPFGHSARRIGDFYAGLVKDVTAASKWKKFRRTKHDHNPVHDALGNVEAMAHILEEFKITI